MRGPGTPAASVRPAASSDLDRIVAIERATFSDPWSRGSFEAFLGDRRIFFAVAAEQTGRPVGYVVVIFASDEGEIANLAVAAEARGAGTGALLLDAALAAARSRGSTRLYLEVREGNAVARSLYASRGFVEVGRRQRYYRRPLEDAIVLRADVGGRD